MVKKIFLLCLFVPSGFTLLAQETQQFYLSGTGKDDTVEWQFYCTKGRQSGEWTTIKVPSCWELEGFGNYNYGHDLSNPDKPMHEEEGLYRHRFSVPEAWKGKAVDIVFEGSMTDTEVKINGALAGPVHQGAFYRFKYDISDLLDYGSENLLEVRVSKMSANPSVNAAERQADYWVFGGIFRPVHLEVKPRQHIERWAIDAKADGTFSADIYLRGEDDATRLSGQITTPDGRKVGEAFHTILDKDAKVQRLSGQLKNPKLWSPEFPNLYYVEFYLEDDDGNIIHQEKERFGFRTVGLREGDGLYVNGTKIRLRGINRHSFWPESGRTLSKQLSIEDVNTIKDMNMNAVRMSHYPPDKHFLEVTDSLGLFVIDELAGWQDAYDTKVGKKLVKEMVIRDVNHPSIIIWSNGNEGGNNHALNDDFSKFDPQNRPLIHPWNIFRGTDTQHYKDFNCCAGTLYHGDEVFFPTEFLHGLYDGGHGAGLQDFWNLMRSKPLSAGGFLWVYADECVVRTDQDGRLDCDGNHAPDGIVGPYHEKEGSYYAVKEIWSPVQVKKQQITKSWDGRLPVGNRFFYTNLNQVDLGWELVRFPGPFDPEEQEAVVSRGSAAAPDIKPQSMGHLELNLHPDWKQADALRLTATDPHGREIYSWSWAIKNPGEWVEQVVGPREPEDIARPQETGEAYVLSAGGLTIRISKQTGFITEITKDNRPISLGDGPYIVGGKSEFQQISREGNQVKATFSDQEYDVIYSLTGDGWLKIHYNYKPHGHLPYIGISFRYPEAKVNGIRWTGNGPYRVWKNRLAGMEYGLWEKEYNNAITGYRWKYPEFKGYHAGLNWAVLDTEEGPITMMVSNPGIYLGLFRPDMPPAPRNTAFEYPERDISFLHAISPIGTKFKKPEQLGPDSRPNLFQYPRGEHAHDYQNTLWLHFGND